MPRPLTPLGAEGPFGLTADPGSGLILTLAAGGVLVGVAMVDGFNRYMRGHEFKDAPEA